MNFRLGVFVSFLVFTGLAAYQENLAAFYVSWGAHFIIYQLHAVEVKVNKLLDAQGIRVTQIDIDRS